jgi:hypothetical protein
MSFLPSNLRLFARFPLFIRPLRRNATTTTTTSNKPNQVPVPTRRNPKYFQIGALVVAVVGVLAMFKAARNERKLMEYSADHQHEPPIAK